MSKWCLREVEEVRLRGGWAGRRHQVPALTAFHLRSVGETSGRPRGDLGEVEKGKKAKTECCAPGDFSSLLTRASLQCLGPEKW